MKRSFAFTLLSKACVLTALIFSACTKENDPAPEVVVRPACRIIKSNFTFLTINLATQYTYDNEDRITEGSTYSGTRKQSIFSYEYNQKGQLSKYISQDYFYDAESNASITTHSYTVGYNEKGQVSAYQYNTTSTNPAIPAVSSTSSCEYDSQGNRTKITTQSGSDAPRVDLHEYKDGNCVK